jgi:hypothetical protein
MIAERQEVTHGTVHSERKAESKGSQRVTHCSSYASWAFVDYQLHSPLANRCSETVDYSILLCRTPGRRGGGAESPLSESPQRTGRAFFSQLGQGRPIHLPLLVSSSIHSFIAYTDYLS